MLFVLGLLMDDGFGGFFAKLFDIPLDGCGSVELTGVALCGSKVGGGGTL
jgi:hypothetical protein